MSEKFKILETTQLEAMHQQTHDSADAGEDCLMLRDQHDSLAAELTKRGIVHDTAIICPEPITDAPNYQRSFTDDICINCAFGQLFPHCNLYDFEYIKDWRCGSFRYFEVLELEPPHGFLMTNGKQTALASVEKRDENKLALVISNGEAFGVAEFEQPAQVSIKSFDSEEWQSQHRITPRERRQWWPDATAFYVYPVKAWYPYEGIKLFETETGRVIDEPKLSAKQWQIVSKSKELPKQIILDGAAVSITDKNEFIICDGVTCQRLNDILSATYETEVTAAKSARETIPVYALALVRNPRMRVSKKNLDLKIGDHKHPVFLDSNMPEDQMSLVSGKNVVTLENVGFESKQEGEDMPFGIELRDDEYCVINTDTDESMGCHETEAEAEAQLTALRINVEADEGDAAADKPQHRKPKKKPRHPKKKPRHPKKEIELTESNFGLKETDEGVVFTKSEEEQLASVNAEQPKSKEKKNFLDGLRGMYKSITEFLNIIDNDESGEEDTKLFPEDSGVVQKLVNGELWHFTWSTNAFKDRDGEIFSTESLEKYVAASEKNKDRGYFNLWHINEEDGNFNTDFAKKEWQGVVGRFLVEAGPYLRNEKGRAARQFFKKYYAGHPQIAPEGWGCSPEYKYLPEERATAIYENIWITRTSTLAKMAAANIWTETRQAKIRGAKMALTEQQRAAADAMFGNDFVTDMLKDADDRTAELEKAGVAHKGAAETEVTKTETVETEAAQEVTQEAPAETEEKQPDLPSQITMTQDQFDTLAGAVAERFQVNNESIVDAMGIMAHSLTAMGDRVAELESKGKAKSKAEQPTFIFELQRASEDKRTEVTDDDDLKGKKPVEANVPKTQANVTPDSFFNTG